MADLACDFPGAGPQRLREALASDAALSGRRDQPYRPYCEDPSTWPLVNATLAQGYDRIAATSLLDVYERKARYTPPQTSVATSTQRASLRHWSSSPRSLPWAVEEKPHWWLNAHCSSGT